MAGFRTISGWDFGEEIEKPGAGSGLIGIIAGNAIGLGAISAYWRILRSGGGFCKKFSAFTIELTRKKVESNFFWLKRFIMLSIKLLYNKIYQFIK